MRSGAALINTFLLSAIITITIYPAMDWLRGKGAPRALAFIITIIMALAVVLSLLFIVAFSVDQFAQVVPTYQDSITSFQKAAKDRLDALGVNTSKTLSGSLDTSQAREGLKGAVSAALKGVSTSISASALFFIILVFMLYEGLSLSIKLEHAGPDIDKGLLERMSHLIANIRSYVTITAIIGAAAGAANTILLLVLGVQFAVLWGILSFIMNFIPNIGFIIAVIPPALIAWLSLGWVEAVVVVIGYILINGISGNVIQPKYIGQGVNLSPSFVFFSLVLWGSILGILGAILAVPLTLAIKELVLERDESTRWLADIISG